MANIQDIQNQLNSSDPKARIEAIKSACDLGSHEAYGLLMYAAHHHFAPETRREAKKGALVLQKKLFGQGESPQISQDEAGQEDLASMDMETRKNAIRALVQNPPENGFKVLLQRLNQEQNPQVQSLLIQACARLGEKEARPYIIQFLRSPDPNVRSSVVRSIGSMIKKEDLALMIRFSRDPDEKVRSSCLSILQKANSEDLMEALRTLLSRNIEVEKDAILFVIVRLAFKAGFGILEELQADSSESIQKRAVRAREILIKQGHLSAPKVDQAEKVEEKVEESGPPSGTEESSTGDKGEELDEMESSLPDLDEEIEKHFRVIRQGEESSAIQSVFALMEINALDRLSELIESVTDRNSKRVTATFIMAIGQSKDQKHKEFLLSSLNHADGRVQANAIDALRMLDLADQVKSQILPLATDSNFDRVRANAIILLHPTGLIDTKSELESMLNSKKDNRKLSALYAIQDLLDTSLVPLLEGAIDSPNPSVTKKALEILKIYVMEGNEQAREIAKEWGLLEEMESETFDENQEDNSEGDQQSEGSSQESMEGLLEEMENPADSEKQKEGGTEVPADSQTNPAEELAEEKGLGKLKSMMKNIFKKKS